MGIAITMRNVISQAFGYRSMDISEDLLDRLTLRYGRTIASFDRAAATVKQNGKLVASMCLVEKIQLRQPLNQEGPPNWYITVHISGRRQVEAGKVTDELTACIIGAKISKITGRPVIVNGRR